MDSHGHLCVDEGNRVIAAPGGLICSLSSVVKPKTNSSKFSISAIQKFAENIDLRIK